MYIPFGLLSLGSSLRVLAQPRVTGLLLETLVQTAPEAGQAGIALTAELFLSGALGWCLVFRLLFRTEAAVAGFKGSKLWVNSQSLSLNLGRTHKIYFQTACPL